MQVHIVIYTGLPLHDCFWSHTILGTSISSILMETPILNSLPSFFLALSLPIPLLSLRVYYQDYFWGSLCAGLGTRLSWMDGGLDSGTTWYPRLMDQLVRMCRANPHNGWPHFLWFANTYTVSSRNFILSENHISIIFAWAWHANGKRKAATKKGRQEVSTGLHACNIECSFMQSELRSRYCLMA